ncbi:hypothetical protein [Polyangium spumosum]|uniref:Peptidase M61 catalytic domain-containing protein n=1 Tax=Polyangium spumosum TaxID=889282 RepID=A0A6N7PM44_9BACT|nr:hypothetical protein [Polyangium spumosum]MRG93078.1 hypothetical protein [Polyangium spumosum]
MARREGMVRLPVCLGLFLFGGCGGSAAAPASVVTGEAPAVHYSIAVDAELRTLSATVCPRDLRLARLRVTRPEDASRVQRPRVVRAAGEVPLEIEQDAVPISSDTDGACIGYDVDLGPPREGFWLAHGGGHVLASPDVWLLAPEPRPAGTRVTASFTLPAGVRVAVPWPEDSRGHRIPETAFTMRGAGAFGALGREALSVGGAALDVVSLGDGFGERAPLVTRWLERSAAALTQLHDDFPVPRVMVLLLPQPGDDVGFGMALRGGGPTVMLMVGSSVSTEALDKDWTAVHELFHLSAPRFHPRDAWLSEGLATYYTDILMGRARMLDEKSAWDDLRDGFQRGNRRGTGRTLRQESLDMHETYAYWRVYWAGAAIALLADVELRKRGVDGGLDAPLRELARCCAQSKEAWSAERFAEFVDERTGQAVMKPLVARYAGSADFPDTAEVLAALGVRGAGRDMTLVEDAPRAGVRKAMMAPRKR